MIQRFEYTYELATHVYDENKAAQVCGVIPGFFKDLSFLMKTLEKRITS